jgi:Secretion system C-terminal sorting domain
MKKSLLVILLLIFTIKMHAQKDTSAFVSVLPQQDMPRSSGSVSVTIYPVPVRDNNFTIKSDRDITFIRITNIIGQDILKVKYNNPLQLIRIMLDNPKRGMYLVTINFSDGTRVVKKILVEESD